MKTSTLLVTALLALANFAYAAPTEINYQGVLTDQNGNPVNGVRAMQIKIYDAPTGGTLLYSEDLGNVPVQDGIYSFSFGANGTSNALTTETVAIANGTVSTFQKVLAAPTVVAGSVTVTDGTYTWDPTNGSSNENDFSVAYSPNLRRVTVTYYNGAPAAGKTISAKFRAPGSGITGALAEDNQPWIEVSLAGVAQTPRQKVLTVPFAAVSNKAISSDTVEGVPRIRRLRIDRFFSFNVWNQGNSQVRSLPFQFNPAGVSVSDAPRLLTTWPIYLPIPCRIVGLEASVLDNATNYTATYAYPKTLGNIIVTLWHKASNGSNQALASLDSGIAFNGGAVVLSAALNVSYEGDNVFWITIEAPMESSSDRTIANGQLQVDQIHLLFEQVENK